MRDQGDEYHDSGVLRRATVPHPELTMTVMAHWKKQRVEILPRHTLQWVGVYQGGCYRQMPVLVRWSEGDSQLQPFC